MEFGSSYSIGGGMSPLMIALIAVFAILLIGVIGRALFVWIRNNNSPLQTVEARVVTKRMKVSGFGRTMTGRNTINNMGSSTYTHYFVTFELEKGNRVELGVKDAEYGMLAEGDRGMLSFQGTRYLGFEQK
ncbi:MAG: DUF2500 domain-containing protein [Verrucomicrobia bacterium]|nr:DUF2500 domain-containing protein [Verrucomicrobiota bacterium]